MFNSIVETASAMNFLSDPTWDIVVIVALIGGGFFYGLSTGKVRIAATLLYTYVAYALFLAFPAEKISAFVTQDVFWVRVVLFTVLFIVLVLFLGGRRRPGRAPASTWWQVFLLSFLQAGLLIHIILGFLPKETIATLAPVTKIVFANPDFTVWWFLIPLVMLIILKRFGAD
jgi:hypothetical protein